MDTLRSMQVFVRVLELGSLSAVAREQATTQPTISKIVAALEKSMNVRLLERSTTKLVPTEQGKRFYERAKRVLEEFGEAVANARGLTEKPAGVLRISAPVSIGVLWLNRLMQEFLATYPDIEIELILNDRLVDLVEEGMDVALRVSGTLPPAAIARKVAQSPRVLVASPGYIDGHPKIRRPQDILAHNYLRFAWASEYIDLTSPSGKTETLRATGRYRINNSLGIRECLLMGSGIALAPAWLVQDLVDGGQLVRVLPRWAGPPQEAHLLYPSRRYQPLRVQKFLQFLEERLVRVPGFLPTEPKKRGAEAPLSPHPE